MLGRVWHSWMNGGRYRIIVAALTGAAFTLAAVVVWAWLSRPPAPFDPIPPGPPQEVTSRVRGVDGPAVRVGADVEVTATRCNTAGHTIGVHGDRVWQSVVPRGSSIARTVFPVAAMIPGCSALRFSNPMPPEVVERSVAIKLATGVDPVWRIAGEAVPVDEDGHDGRARPYTTPNFTVVVP